MARGHKPGEVGGRKRFELCDGDWGLYGKDSVQEAQKIAYIINKPA
jgi:hypothetical protein